MKKAKDQKELLIQKELEVKQSLSDNLDIVNEEDLLERLSKVDVKEKEDKVRKEKVKMYSFEYKGLNYEEQKKQRQKIRNRLIKFSNQIILTKIQKSDNKDVIKDFLTFYKSEYLLNDLSLKSIYKGKEEIKISDYNIMLDIIKLSKAKK